MCKIFNLHKIVFIYEITQCTEMPSIYWSQSIRVNTLKIGGQLVQFYTNVLEMEYLINVGPGKTTEGLRTTEGDRKCDLFRVNTINFIAAG